MQYFIDSVYGCDENDGLSRQGAFKSVDKINSLLLNDGDSVLFKAGCEYSGSLAPKRVQCTGIVTFDRYGVGEKPIIIGDREAAVDLSDISWVEVRNLAITNPDGLYGVLICNNKGGETQHVHVTDCHIFNVYGDHERFYINTGGITITTGKENPAWYRDLLVQDNHIHDVCRTGVILHTFWSNRPWKTWANNEYISDTENWWPSYEVVFRGNFIERPAGDAIVLIGAIDPLMEWNVAYEVMANPKPPCANAGIWPQSTENCIVQYNEVGFAHKPEGCNDAQGFDVDLSCRNTIVQYNYSHDNEGGFLLLCELPNTGEYGYTGTIVRNNLSVNDGNTKGELIALVGPVRNAVFTNNTIYSSGNVDRIVEVWTADGKDHAENIEFYNNIFISNGKDNRFNLLDSKTFKFENNLYWGAHHSVPNDHLNAIVEDPGIAIDGSSGNGRENAEKYVPREGSISLSCGVAEKTSSDKDFFGNNTANTSFVGAFMRGMKK